MHPAAVRQSRVHPRRRSIDPKAKRGHDALDHVKDRLLPSNGQSSTLSIRGKGTKAVHLEGEDA